MKIITVKFLQKKDYPWSESKKDIIDKQVYKFFSFVCMIKI